MPLMTVDTIIAFIKLNRLIIFHTKIQTVQTPLFYLITRDVLILQY